MVEVASVLSTQILIRRGNSRNLLGHGQKIQRVV